MRCVIGGSGIACASPAWGAWQRLAAAADLAPADPTVRGIGAAALARIVGASGPAFGADDDPELVAAAVPFCLKLIEGALAAAPLHRGLLLAAAQAFVQYAYAFVEMPADELADTHAEAARVQRGRAAKLYRRASRYGLRGLEAAHPGIVAALLDDPAAAVARTVAEDAAALYWTGIAWAAGAALAREDRFRVADPLIVEALVRRALALDDACEHGAAHVFMIGFEMHAAGLDAGAAGRARGHYTRAVALTDSRAVAPYVAYAEAVSTAARNRAEFEHLLQGALKLDVDGRPEWRLANLVMQRRARWLLSRTHRLFPW